MLEWRKLVHMPDAELARLDIVLVNLACAEELPGSGRIDGDECARSVDAYAIIVKRWTDAAYVQYYRAFCCEKSKLVIGQGGLR